MTLSKRERMIAIVVVVGLGALALNSMLVEPLFAHRSSLIQSISDETARRESDDRLINARSANAAKWKAMEGGVLKRDQSEAESQLLNWMGDWAREAGVTVEQLIPGRVPQPVNRAGARGSQREPAFLKLTCRFVGSGGMSQLAHLIWQIQNSEIPIRITDLSITNKKQDGTADELQLNLGLNTIFLAPDVARRMTGAPAGSTTRTMAGSPSSIPSTRTETRQ